MKKCLLILFTILILTAGACAKTAAPYGTSEQETNQIPAAAPEITPSPTPVPDFSQTDFSGKWQVKELVDSNGETVSQDILQSMETSFTLELLSGDEYFVYDENGGLLGQGTYSVTLNLLTLTAADEETVYEIQNEDTICCTLSDRCVTVMEKSDEESLDADDANCEDTDENSEDTDENNEDTDEGSEDTDEGSEDTDEESEI